MIFNVLIFIAIIVGIGLIVFSVINLKPKDESNVQEGINDGDKAINKLTLAINDADNAMDELSKLSQNIFDEINGKYQELLYLYSLIDEKQKDLSFEYKKVDVSVGNNALEEDIMPKNFMNAFNSNNPKHKEIKLLRNEGMSISEIAKSLNLGQGEVKLVLELGKDR